MNVKTIELFNRNIHLEHQLFLGIQCAIHFWIRISHYLIWNWRCVFEGFDYMWLMIAPPSNPVTFPDVAAVWLAQCYASAAWRNCNALKVTDMQRFVKKANLLTLELRRWFPWPSDRMHVADFVSGSLAGNRLWPRGGCHRTELRALSINW